ncbi:MAG: hypothetical protein QXH20_02945 [Candidatus Bathyarchaeia archaeon]
MLWNWIKRFIEFYRDKERIIVLGKVTVRLRDAKTGQILYEETGYNKVVKQGREYALKNIIQDTSQYNGNYLCLSSNSSAPSDTETTVPNLITPTKTATKSVGTDSSGEPYAQWNATWGTDEANTTIYSVAIAENSDGTGEWCRYILASSISKNNTQTLEVTYQWQLSSS